MSTDSGSGSSWKLLVFSENTVDATRTTPQMTGFAASVKLKKQQVAQTGLTGEKVFQWDKRSGSLLVTSFQQKTSLRFRMVRNMDYMIEIARYDSYASPEDDRPQKTNWTASLWNTEWDTELMANGSLEIGESADWDPRIGTFFPDPYGKSSIPGGDSEGLKEFLQIVRDVADFLDEIRGKSAHPRI